MTDKKHECQFCDKPISQEEIFATTDDACYECCLNDMLDNGIKCINNTCPNYEFCKAA